MLIETGHPAGASLQQSPSGAGGGGEGFAVAFIPQSRVCPTQEYEKVRQTRPWPKKHTHSLLNRSEDLQLSTEERRP